MWKILIADDEAFSRYALRTFLAKGNYPIDEVIEATDGDEAVSLALEHKPDLIFLDIKMPGRNGIEAAAAIIEMIPSTRIIMLTAYDYFDYIQKALEIGVKGYILKPFQFDELSRKVDSVLKEPVITDWGPEKHLEDLKEYATSELLDLLLFPSTEDEREGVLLRFTGVPAIHAGVMLLVYRENLSPQFQQWLCQSLCPDNSFLLGRGYGIPLIALFPNGNAQTILHSLQTVIKSHPESQGIRAVLVSWQERNRIPLAFRDALKALDEANRGIPMLIQPHAEHRGIPSNESFPKGFPYETEDALIAALEQGRFDEVNLHLEQLCDFLQSENLPIPEAVDHIAELIAIIRRSAYRCGYRLDQSSAIVPLRILLTFRDIASGIKLLRELVNQYRSEAGQVVDNLPIWKLSRAFLYVRKNLYGELSLELVADEVGLSSQYLSKRFKEEYGKSFTEYVTTERIHRARFLLGTTDMNVKAVCSAVGYSDANYFSRVFKKETGMTPQQYRDRVSDSAESSIGTNI